MRAVQLVKGQQGEVKGAPLSIHDIGEFSFSPPPKPPFTTSLEKLHHAFQHGILSPNADVVGHTLQDIDERAVLARLERMGGDVIPLNERFDRYFEFMKVKVPGIEEGSRENFKQHLWKLFLERSNYDQEKDGKRWDLGVIQNTTYLQGALAGFCLAMDRMIACEEQKEPFITVDFIKQLHAVMTNNVHTEDGKPMPKGGEFAFQDKLGAGGATRYGEVSARFMEQHLQQLQGKEGEAVNVRRALRFCNSSGKAVGYYGIDQTMQMTLLKTKAGEESVCLDYSCSGRGTSGSLRVPFGNSLIRRQIDRLSQTGDYLEFAQQSLFLHPFIDGNGRIFNHVLSHVCAIAKGEMPHLTYHQKCHEFLCPDEMQLMKQEGQEAFKALVLEGKPLSQYVAAAYKGKEKGYACAFTTFMQDVVESGVMLSEQLLHPKARRDMGVSIRDSVHFEQRGQLSLSPKHQPKLLDNVSRVVTGQLLDSSRQYVVDQDEFADAVIAHLPEGSANWNEAAIREGILSIGKHQLQELKKDADVAKKLAVDIHLKLLGEDMMAGAEGRAINSQEVKDVTYNALRDAIEEFRKTRALSDQEMFCGR